MTYLFYAHSGLRYLVLLAGVVATLYLLVGWLRGRPWDTGASALPRVFVVLLDVQVLLGVLLLLSIPFYPALAGHIVTMLAAVTVGHVAVARNKRADEPSWATGLLAVVVPLALVVLGIVAIGRPIFGSAG